MVDIKKPAGPGHADLVPGKGDSPHAVPTKPSKSFVFIGDKHGHGPDKITLFGIEFEKNGKAVKVDDPNAVAKLDGNSHFKAA